MIRRIKIYNSSSLMTSLFHKKGQLAIAILEVNSKGKILGFKYSQKWLECKDRYPINPRLPLSNKRYTQDKDGIDLSIFRDCEDDSWGLDIARRLAVVSSSDIDKIEEISIMIDLPKEYTGMGTQFKQDLIKNIKRRFNSGKDDDFANTSKNFNSKVTKDQILEKLKQIDANEEQKVEDIDYLLSRKNTLGLGDLHYKKDKEFYSLANKRQHRLILNSSLFNFVILAYYKNLYYRLSEREKFIVLKSLNDRIGGLGGRRPKLNVTMPQDNSIWVLKFPLLPSNLDVYRIYIAMNLAKLLNLNVPAYRLLKQTNPLPNIINEHLKSKKEILLFYSKRFDIDGDKKIPFASANSLLGNRYKLNSSTRHSYLELATFINIYGDDADLEEMWKRMVLNICIGNLDDNFYNHGFLYINGKWRLSPLYGIKFSTDCISKEKGLGLNIDNTENKLDLTLALKVLPYFKFSKDRALAYIKELFSIILKNESSLLKIGVISKEMIAKIKAKMTAKT